MADVCEADDSRVAIVVSGAGARGAYEAGVLRELLVACERADSRPTIYVGTSAGAINATLLAAYSHLSPSAQGEALTDVWSNLQFRDVIGPVMRTFPRKFVGFAGSVVRFPKAHLTSLFDTAPLERTARRYLSRDQLARNFRDGCLEALAVVATRGRTGGTVVFTERAPEVKLPEAVPERRLEYVDAAIDAPHVMASSAIPALFPPVKVDDPEGWYVDGGLRLNAPLKPALDLGAGRLLVVATHPIDDPPCASDSEIPDLDDILVQLLDTVLVDRMVEDVRTLEKVNKLVAAGGDAAKRNGTKYKKMPLVFLSPDRAETLAVVARTVYGLEDRSTLSRFIRNPVLALLDGFTGSDGPRGAELLSFLFFEPEYIARLIELGRSDARRALGSRKAALPWSYAG